MFGDFNAQYIVVVLISLLVSLTIHEFMHAFVGHKLGDDTAEREGRLTLNPIAHIDPVMTLLLPAVTLLIFQAPILAAKPVPFNPARVRFDDYGAAMIAAAGPLSNLALAIVGAVMLQFLSIGSFAAYCVEIFVVLNVALFVFNMLPIPPLDGSRVLYAFAPDGLRRVMEQLEQFGLFIIFGLVLLGGSLGFGDFLRELKPDGFEHTWCKLNPDSPT